MSGQIISNAAGQLIKAVGGGGTITPVINNVTILNNTSPTTNNTTTNNTTSNSTVVPVIPPSGNRISYPIRFAYVNSLTAWWPASAIAAGFAVPGFAKNHTYNYVALAFWTSNAGAVDAAKEIGRAHV